MPKNYKVVKQKLKSTSGEFFIYRFLSMKCRSAYNTALANIKKHYTNEKKYINMLNNVLLFYWLGLLESIEHKLIFVKIVVKGKNNFILIFFH